MERVAGGLLAFLLMATSATSEPIDFEGRFAVHAADGPSFLTLGRAPTGDFAGFFEAWGRRCEVSGTYGEDEEDPFVEGEIACDGGGGGEFELSFDEDEEAFTFFLTPFEPDGTPRLDLAVSYVAERADSTFGRAEAPSPLVGVWSTQVIASTPGGSVTTQLFMELRSDGLLVDLGSRSIGGTGDVTADTGLSGGGESALWRTEGDILQASVDGRQWAPLARFELAGDRMLLDYYDGDRALWHRTSR